MALFSFYEKIFDCFNSYFVNKQENKLLRIQMLNVKDFIKFITFDYKIDFIGNFALLFLHKDNINEYFEEIKLQSNFIFPDNDIFGFHSKLDNLKVNILKEIEDYENGYKKTISASSITLNSDLNQYNDEDIDVKKNRIINDLYKYFKEFGLQEDSKSLESFLRGKIKNVIFHRNKSAKYLNNYEFGFILRNINKVFNEFKPNSCFISIYENGKPNKISYGKFIKALKPYHMDLSNKRTIRPDFYELYQFILKNF